MKIWIFNSPKASAYGVLSHFSQSLAKALEKLGAEVYVYEEIPHLPRPHDPDFFLSFFNVNIKSTPSNTPPIKPPWEALKVPHIYIAVDALEYFENLQSSPYFFLSVRDEESYRILKSRGFENLLYLPHAAERSLEPNFSSPKEYEVSLLGSLFIKDVIDKSLLSFPPPYQEAVQITLEILFSDISTSYREAFQEACDLKKLAPLSTPNLLTLYKIIEMKARYQDRLNLLKSIKHIPVHVFGKSFDGQSWNTVLDQKNIIYHPEVNFDCALDVMRKSKITLNSSPTIKEGGHERLFYAYQCGALPMTNETTFINRWFKDGTNILTYKTNRYEEVESKLLPFLQDENRRQLAVLSGREIVLEHHTWDERAKTLYSLLSNYKTPK